MTDSDLALLYNVETKRLNESVKRNSKRFPESFCFQLAEDEYADLRSQIATSNHRKCIFKRRTQVFAICLYRAGNSNAVSSLKE